MRAEYSHWIVALSYVIAVIASYVALDMASRVSASRGTKTARYWLVGGAVAMGAGIWSMHFVGMLAFTLPIPVPYSIPVTFLSLLFAVGASGVALYTISRAGMTTRRLVTAGTIMGSGVALMHYTGMFALKITPRPTYDPGLFAVSVVIAIAASIVAMWICFQLKSDTVATAFWKKSASALVMGIAIWGMHFTGMAAAIFDANSVCGVTTETIDNKWLATTVGLCSLFFLSTAMLISLVDAKISEHRTTLEAQSERFFNQSLNLICICDSAGRFQRLNPAGWSTLGHSRAALLGQPFGEIITAADRPVVEASLQQLAQGRTAALSIESLCLCANGATRAFLWNITHSGDDGGFYATGHDISERKRAESELATTYQRLLSVSRLAGMAEVATGVLHNVGNVLNSVTISAGLAMDKVRRSQSEHLARICQLLDQHQGDLGEFLTANPQGRLIPELLSALSGKLTQEQGAVLEELENLRKSIEHIKSIVTMQQNHAKVAGVTETLPLTELVDAALHINAEDLSRHHIELVRDYGILSSVTVDKHKVMQILINLIRNARHACDESNKKHKCIIVRTSGDDHGLRIEVADNGIGITPENLTRIFNHGFTTRKDGHGFGLHTGALAARELGGSLTVTSEGPGQGAVFTLELPYQHQPAGETVAAH